MAEISKPEPQKSSSNKNTLYYLEVLLRWKNFIIFNTLIVAVITSAICLLMPNWYKSTASILPPKQQDLFGAAAGASSLLKGITGGKGLGSLGKNQTGYNYLAILKSRTTMAAVIEKFNLMQVYEIKNNNIDLAIKALEENVLAETQDDENITVEVLDKDPRRAADMANYFVELLNTTSIRLGTQEARNNREFIERRLDQCRDDLRRAEDSLKIFQQKKEIFISQDAKNSSAAAYAELYAMKAKKEIEIGVLQKFVAPDNQSLRQLEVERGELTKKVSTFPQAGLEGVRLYREVLTQDKILEFLLPIYEQAKIDEQKDIPVLLVLDKAVPATRKAKPARSLIILLVTFVAFSGFIMGAFIFQGVLQINASSSPLLRKVTAALNSVKRRYRIPEEGV